MYHCSVEARVPYRDRWLGWTAGLRLIGSRPIPAGARRMWRLARLIRGKIECHGRDAGGSA